MKIAVVTDPESAAGYRFAGLDVAMAQDAAEARRILSRMIQEGTYALIAVSEALLPDPYQALRREMAERQRLEEEILQISEREQRRIGHDLHDSLCQHLTATALAGQVLRERLAAKSMAEASDARKVIELVESGIDLARNLVRGLYPV